MTNPDTDNLYPNQGDYFQPSVPVEQDEEARKEENEVVTSTPIIKDVIAHLDERIVFYSSIDSISDESLTQPNDFMHIVAANKLVKSCLVTEKRKLEGLLQAHEK